MPAIGAHKPVREESATTPRGPKFHFRMPRWVLAGVGLLLGIAIWMAIARARLDHEQAATKALIQAVRMRQWQRVPELLDEGADPNAGLTIRGNGSGFMGMVRAVLPWRPRYGGPSLLNVSLQCSAFDTAKALLLHGASPNNGGAFVSPPVVTAAMVGSTELTLMLLDHGADLEARASDRVYDARSGTIYPDPRMQGATPLLAALNAHNVDLAHCLLQRGAHLGARTTNGDSVLMLAALACDIETMRKCLAAGQSAASTDKVGQTPLHFAARGGSVEAIRILLDGGADINAVDVGGRTPLLGACNACLGGHTEAAQYLLEHGADVTVTDRSGWNAIMLTASCVRVRGGAKTSLLDVLLKHGADVVKATAGAGRLLPTQAYNSDATGLSWLLEHGAPADTVDQLGNTTLETAARQGNLEVVRILLAHGAHVDKQDSLGNTALTIAVMQAGFEYGPERLEMMRVLLQHGADPLAQRRDGMTPMNIAAKYRARRSEPYQILLRAAKARKDAQPRS